jgi:hypothetical protein
MDQTCGRRQYLLGVNEIDPLRLYSRRVRDARPKVKLCHGEEHGWVV